MASVHSGEESLPKGSTPRVGCTNVTDDRQTDDRRNCDSKDPNVTQSRSGKNLEVNGITIESNEEKACRSICKNIFKQSSNDNYSSNFNARKDDIETNHKYLFENTSDCSNNPKLTDLNEPFALHELRRAPRDVEKHSALGADRISYEILQKLPKCSIKAVLKLCNQIWTKDDFPVSWRDSIVLPILKAGKDPIHTTSYRPISLTPTLCKLMEKMVTTRLTYHVEKNNILNNIQCGFRKGRSTIDHIIRLQDTINKYNNNKGYTVAGFFYRFPICI